jgi:hypothetical protein
MYKRFGKRGLGYTADDYWMVCADLELKGREYYRYELCEGTGDYLAMLKHTLKALGWKLEWKSSGNRFEDYYGVVIDDHGRVSDVVFEGPADDVGIGQEMKITQINGQSVQKNAKLLFNQITFNDACDFNNVYVFAVPRLGAIQNENTPIDLFYAQKQSIVDKLEDYKMVTHNVVIRDPIYIGFDIGLGVDSETLTSDIREETKIRITRSQYDLISKEQIKSTVFNLIKSI